MRTSAPSIAPNQVATDLAVYLNSLLSEYIAATAPYIDDSGRTLAWQQFTELSDRLFDQTKDLPQNEYEELIQLSLVLTHGVRGMIEFPNEHQRVAIEYCLEHLANLKVDVLNVDEAMRLWNQGNHVFQMTLPEEYYCPAAEDFGDLHMDRYLCEVED